MTKRRVGSQIGNLTPDHKKSRIALIYLCSGGVPHTIGKISTKDITLLKTSLQSKVYTQSYGPPKLWESQFREFWDSNLGVLGQNDIWVLLPWPMKKNTIRRKVMASPSPGCGESYKFMFAHGLFVHQNYSNYALTNLLFCLYRSTWVIDLLVIVPSHYPKGPMRPSTPKCYKLGSVPKFLIIPLCSP
jgi:hypothetical protein